VIGAKLVEAPCQEEGVGRRSECTKKHHERRSAHGETAERGNINQPTVLSCHVPRLPHRSTKFTHVWETGRAE